MRFKCSLFSSFIKCSLFSSYINAVQVFNVQFLYKVFTVQFLYKVFTVQFLYKVFTVQLLYKCGLIKCSLFSSYKNMVQCELLQLYSCLIVYQGTVNVISSDLTFTTLPSILQSCALIILNLR